MNSVSTAAYKIRTFEENSSLNSFLQELRRFSKNYTSCCCSVPNGQTGDSEKMEFQASNITYMEYYSLKRMSGFIESEVNSVKFLDYNKVEEAFLPMFEKGTIEPSQYTRVKKPNGIADKITFDVGGAIYNLQKNLYFFYCSEMKKYILIYISWKC